MNFLTPLKIKAARALLNWSQKDLHEHAGISMQTVRNIERDETNRLNLTSDTSSKIIKCFWQNGVEITDTHVGYIKNAIVVYEGQSGYQSFRIDLYDTMKDGGEVLVSNVDEREFLKWDGGEEGVQKHTNRMCSIPNLDMKVLVKEGDHNFPGISYATYRWTPAHLFTQDVLFYIYGHKTALLVFSDNNVRITIMTQEEITEALRKQFYSLWQNSKEPDLS